MKISEVLNDNTPKYVDISIIKNIDEERFVSIYSILTCYNKCEGYEYKDRIINKVRTYFEELLNAIRNDNKEKLNYLSKNIGEAKFTKLGYSKTKSGSAIGKKKFEELINSIKKSDAYETGDIGDILDVQLYADKIDVDNISDLITNLVYDVFSDYTVGKLENLGCSDRLDYYKLHYWNENLRQWEEKELSVISFGDMENLSNEERYNYLLVPFSFTSDKYQTRHIYKDIFDNIVYDLFSKKFLENPYDYQEYIYEYADGIRKKVNKKSVAKFIKDKFSKDFAKESGEYLTPKGLLYLIKNYSEVRDYVEKNIKYLK